MRPLKNKLAVTILVLSVAFFGIIIFSLNSDSSIISSGAGNAVTPLQKIVYSVNERLKNSVDFFLNFSKVKEENIALTNENTELENKLVDYENIKQENERLKEMFKYSETKDSYEYVGVNVIGYSGGNFTDGYVIDKGTDDGITKEMVVITAKGLVGKVTRAEKDYSIVQSILNENIAVSGMVQSTRDSSGIIRGSSNNKNKEEGLVQMYNLPMNSEVKKGDIILTSGLGMIYPKEIKIGKVVEVEVDKVKVMKNAIIEPYIEFDKLEELFVVIPKDMQDIKYN